MATDIGIVMLVLPLFGIAGAGFSLLSDPAVKPAVVPVRSGQPEVTQAPPGPKIDFFDCADVDKDFTPEMAKTKVAQLPIDRRLSQWEAGGPGGAAWNAGDLRCEVVARTSCTKGTITLELRVGKALVGTQSLALPRKTAEWRFLVKQMIWQKNLDQTERKRAVVDTAIFRATALLACDAPEPVKPGFGSRRDYAVEATAVFGFAVGE